MRGEAASERGVLDTDAKGVPGFRVPRLRGQVHELASLVPVLADDEMGGSIGGTVA